MIPHVLTSQSLTVLLDSRSVAVPRSHPNFDTIVQHLNDNDPAELRKLLDVKQAVSNFTQGAIVVNDRVLTYNGTELHANLTQKIIEFMREGDPSLAAPLINFLDKVMLNPSHRAVRGLYDWVAASNMPIAADGDIYAWKIVQHDYFDYYSKTLDHHPGNVVTQARNMCDEDPDQTCSNGIHFCSFAYLPQYQSGDETRRVMLVKINPADVVAIPRDYGTAKGRTCKLTVIEQVPQSELETFFPTRTVFAHANRPMDNYRGFEVGQVWRDNGGDKMTVVRIDLYNNVVECRCGQIDFKFEFDLDGDDITDKYRDLCLNHLVSDEEPEPTPKFKVGEVWLDNDGDELTITEVTATKVSANLMSLGSFYVFNHDGSPLPGRCLKLISKVR